MTIIKIFTFENPITDTSNRRNLSQVKENLYEFREYFI